MIQLGSIVRRKHGGPPLTAEFYVPGTAGEDAKIVCSWVDPHGFIRAKTFLVTELEVVTEATEKA
ncbi:DUF2158 domain-containing protein [Pelomonas sp. KK5]|uniref:DUF2158 domain-containing protein n=1 Tax=Pelomonas sp. KK5 TaxID=1855730 RepID=UPI00097CA397|nr:DUF2158 domain-containing protein [Pelomonas sp. KK5]